METNPRPSMHCSLECLLNRQEGIVEKPPEESRLTKEKEETEVITEEQHMKSIVEEIRKRQWQREVEKWSMKEDHSQNLEKEREKEKRVLSRTTIKKK